MRENFLIFGSPLIGEPEIAEVVDCLRSGWVGTGPKVQRFETMVSQYLGVAHCRCVSSCTAALIIGLQLLGVGPGDEVLVPAMTFVASANAVEHAGATPVLVDSVPGTGLIDFELAEAAITPRTRAIMPVHLAGRPVDMERLARLRDEHGLKVIEDAAHAIGAEWRGRRIGALGNLTAFSFYVTKNISTIEGGALVTEDAEIAAEVERLALHGLSLGAWQRFSDTGFRHYEVVRPGFKYNMTDVQAALGLHQLPQLDGWIEDRARLWDRYDALLADLPLETPPAPEPGTRHARHLYQVLLDPDAPLGRDELLDRLIERRIGTGVHYRGVHLHPYYRDRYGFQPADFPVATAISDRTLSLPLSPKVSEADQDDLVSALRDLLAR
ncbi:MAG: DegT/DnrJ/EryC1/StrS family aminotransferase [Solirubrobacterales bacterium]|nr:DegT/DnrJ/EryC1/StrS family aminotransferase [Solirubrobacterales bacterium]MBV9716879.1 DegT/DnrJ/EryC1/StrS family aminotransferase [Solirubrobacterales bacterium]